MERIDTDTLHFLYLYKQPWLSQRERQVPHPTHGTFLFGKMELVYEFLYSIMHPLALYYHDTSFLMLEYYYFPSLNNLDRQVIKLETILLNMS